MQFANGLIGSDKNWNYINLPGHYAEGIAELLLGIDRRESLAELTDSNEELAEAIKFTTGTGDEKFYTAAISS